MKMIENACFWDFPVKLWLIFALFSYFYDAQWTPNYAKFSRNLHEHTLTLLLLVLIFLDRDDHKLNEGLSS